MDKEEGNCKKPKVMVKTNRKQMESGRMKKDNKVDYNTDHKWLNRKVQLHNLHILQQNMGLKFTRDNQVNRKINYN